jgi:hypothetical protein
VKQEAGCLSASSRVLAVIIALLLVVSMPMALVVFDIEQVMFSKDKVTQIIGDQLAASGDVRSLLVISFLSNPGPQGSDANAFSLVRAAQGLTPEQKQELTNLLLPQDWFLNQVGSVLGGIYAWIDGVQPRPQLALDLRPLKERLLNGGAQQLMLLLINSWPQCSSGQLAQIEDAIRFSRIPPMLYCRPAGTLLGPFTDQSTAWFTNQVRAMPDSVSLTGQKLSAAQTAELTVLRDRIRLARDVMRYGWMLPASLFGLIMALAIRSWTGLTRWWGAPLAGTGLASLLMIPFARPLQARLVGRLQPGEALPPVLLDTLAHTASGIRSAVVRALAAQAIILLLFGAGLLVGGWLWSRRRPSSREPAPAGPSQPQSLDAVGRPSGLFG